MSGRPPDDAEDSPLTRTQAVAWYGFLRAHAAIVQALDTDLQATQRLPLSSFDVLAQLARAPAGRLRMTELARAVLLSRSGLTRLVERLERQGLVARCRGETDSRTVFAMLTELGEARLRAATPAHFAAVRARFLNHISEGHLRQLASIWGSLLGEERSHPNRRHATGDAIAE